MARWFPPNPIFPSIVIVWTARQACNPPRAATFLSAISAADSFADAGELPAAAATEKTDATETRIARSCCITQDKPLK